MKAYQSRALVKARERLKTRQRILIADTDNILARRLSDYLWDHGFEARVTKSISEAKDLVEFWHPHSVFIDLMLPQTSALSLFKLISARKFPVPPRVIVMSKQASPKGIEQMRKAGAAHYLVKPFSLEDALRVIGPKDKTPVTIADFSGDQGPAMLKELHLINLFLKQATLGKTKHANLFNLMRMINIKVKGMRTSLIHCLNDQHGSVLASNDDEHVQGLSIDLKDYPEMREVKRRQSVVVIPNVRTSDILAPVMGKLAQTPFETLVLFPVFRHGTFFGVLSVRLEQQDTGKISYIEKFGLVCSQIISLTIDSPAMTR